MNYRTRQRLIIVSFVSCALTASFSVFYQTIINPDPELLEQRKRARAKVYFIFLSFFSFFSNDQIIHSLYYYKFSMDKNLLRKNDIQKC